MRHYMVDPDNEDRLLKIPPRVVAAIKAEAYAEARDAVAGMNPHTESGTSLGCVYLPDALAAIDALTLERQPPTPTQQPEPLEKP